MPTPPTPTKPPKEHPAIVRKWAAKGFPAATGKNGTPLGKKQRLGYNAYQIRAYRTSPGWRIGTNTCKSGQWQDNHENSLKRFIYNMNNKSNGKSGIKISLLIGSTCVFAGTLCRAGNPAPPVTPDAAPEAVELLHFIYRISGQHILTGQHNYAGDNDKETVAASKAWGKVPAIFGKDWGYAKKGDSSSAFVRQDTVDEIKEHYKNGSLIVMCWHEVPPTADEPVAFSTRRSGGSTYSSPNLNTVQGHLTEAQYKDLLTPGTTLHQHWCDQVDAIVPYLKQLQDAHVPVLWRPFHEMNGQWFWWGGRPKTLFEPDAYQMKGGERMGLMNSGDYSTAALYKMMFDRLVNHHKLKNLIWVWNVDRPEGTTLPFNECWPGPEYVDVVSFDCYRVFKQSYYDDLLKLDSGTFMQPFPVQGFQRSRSGRG